MSINKTKKRILARVFVCGRSGKEQTPCWGPWKRVRKMAIKKQFLNIFGVKFQDLVFKIYLTSDYSHMLYVSQNKEKSPFL